jgi:hypothetical protein
MASDKGTLNRPARRARSLDFEKIIGAGEHAGGFTSQTANGTGKFVGTGWNQQFDFGPMPEAPERGPWQKPHSNRTGE